MIEQREVYQEKVLSKGHEIINHYDKLLEGNVRNTGVHACGTIICRDDITDWVQAPFAFVTGLALGWMYYRTGSLLPRQNIPVLFAW